MSVVDHPYAGLLDRVEKPARYLGGEYLAKPREWDDPALTCRFVLAFPDLYDIGMSHLGTKILYKVINECPDLAMERSFCPWFDMEHELREAKLPLISLENRKPLRSFDVVGFSLQYEMTYTNVLTMLDLGGIPLRSENREDKDPIVIAGGPCATHPESIAPFIDAFLIGDAEAALPEFLRRVGSLRKEGLGRTAILEHLAALPGIYVPALYDVIHDDRTGLQVVGKPRVSGIPERITRCLVEDLSKFPFPQDSPVSLNEAIFDRMSIEIARGCTEGCRFCQAGMIYRPVRERSPEDILECLEGALEKGGYDEASLTSLSTADYSCISPLIQQVMQRLRPKRIGLGISSLRAYGLDENLLDEIASVKATGLTFAPEAGSQRMRDVINKNISEDDIKRTCHRVFARGWRKMKLYFILGLPTEDMDDLQGIADLGRKAVNIGREYHGTVSVTVSVSSHVPKPHTPFQWCAMDSMDQIAEKQEFLWQQARRARFKLRKHDMRVSHLEGIIGRADRRAADLIESAWQRGARFDSWDDRMNWDVWQIALEEWEASHEIKREIFTGTLPVDARLPWDHIDVGLEDGFLKGEYARALKDRLSPPCGKPMGEQVHHTNLKDAREDERKLVCYHCGVACDLSGMREERIQFLEDLDAQVAPVSSRGNWREQSIARIAKGEAPHDFEQGKALRLRIRMERLNSGRYFSQLDVVRMLPQILRRAGLTLYYSQGFSPHPIMSFSPAIGFGSGSIADYADVQLAMESLPPGIDDTLRAVSPPGLLIAESHLLKEGEPILSKRIQAMDWLLQLPPEWEAFDLEQRAEDKQTYIDKLTQMAAERLADISPVKVLRKKKTRELQLQEQIVDLQVGDSSLWPNAGDLDPDHLYLYYRQLQVSGVLIKPDELLSVIGNSTLQAESVLRLACLAEAEDKSGWLDPFAASWSRAEETCPR